MDAQVADRLVIRGSGDDGQDRVGEIVAVVEGQGARRFRVRWSDGHESIYTPGAGAEIDSAPRQQAEWDAKMSARRAQAAARRLGVTAGVGREAALALQKLDSAEKKSASVGEATAEATDETEGATVVAGEEPGTGGATEIAAGSPAPSAGTDMAPSPSEAPEAGASPPDPPVPGAAPPGPEVESELKPEAGPPSSGGAPA